MTKVLSFLPQIFSPRQLPLRIITKSSLASANSIYLLPHALVQRQVVVLGEAAQGISDQRARRKASTPRSLRRWNELLLRGRAKLSSPKLRRIRTSCPRMKHNLTRKRITSQGVLASPHHRMSPVIKIDLNLGPKSRLKVLDASGGG